MLLFNHNFQIFCSPNLSAFKWMKTSSRKFSRDLKNNRGIRGGLERNMFIFLSPVYIGRVSYGGETIVGKIPTDHPESTSIYFVQNGKERKADSYEMLINDGNDVSVEQIIGEWNFFHIFFFLNSAQ